MNQPRNADRRSLNLLLVLFFAAASTLMVACVDDDVDEATLEPGSALQQDDRGRFEARGDVSDAGDVGESPSFDDESPLYTPSSGDSMTLDNDVPSNRSALNVELGEDFEGSGDYGESLDDGESFAPVGEGEEVEISAASDDEIQLEGNGFDDSGADFDLDDNGEFEPVANEDLDASESFSPMVAESTQPIDDDAYLTEFEEDTESFSPVANERPGAMSECDPTATEPLGSWGAPSPNRLNLDERFADGRRALMSLGGSSDALGGWGSGTELASAGGLLDLSALIGELRAALSDANDVVIASAEAGGFQMSSYEPVSIAEAEDASSDDFQSVSYESDGENACGFQTTDAWSSEEE